jgi:hypothetical protein
MRSEGSIRARKGRKHPEFMRLAVLLILGTLLLAQPPSRQGDKPYTPTRLEWLAADMNARMRVDLTPESGFSMEFIPVAGTDTITIYVVYLPSVVRQVMNTYIDAARRVISIETRSRGWDSWLKVKEQVELGKMPAEKP